MGFTKDQLDACRGQPLPDLIGPDVRLLFVVVNPGLWSVAAQAHFAHPANRFWPALFAGRVLDHPIRPSLGMSTADRRYLIKGGIGITSMIPTATGDAAAITVVELRAARKRLLDVARSCEPRVVAVCGYWAFQVAFGRKERLVPGRQHQRVANSEVWVVPNPAARNPDVNITELGAAYRAAANAAGVVPGVNPQLDRDAPP